MTIDRAIELLGFIENRTVVGDIEEWQEAIKLGVEALKLTLKQRNIDTYTCCTILKGETEQ